MEDGTKRWGNMKENHQNEMMNDFNECIIYKYEPIICLPNLINKHIISCKSQKELLSYLKEHPTRNKAQIQ